MLECQPNPLKAGSIGWNPFKFSDVSRHEIGSSFELPRDVDVIQCFDRPVKTSCGYVNMAKKAENAHWKFF